MPGKSWKHGGGDRSRGGVGRRGVGREKGERTDWREFGGVGRSRWRKGRYRSREEDTYIKGSILRLARDLSLEGIPGFHGDVPS